jgi:hypothetical protein
MRLRQRARAVLFIIFSVWTTGLASGFTVAVSGGVNCQLSSALGYGPKYQLGGEAAADVLFPVTPWLSIGPSAGVLGANASNLDGGFGYRSYLGGFLGAAAAADAPLATWPYVGALRAGGRLALLANVAMYGSTTLAFFFPSLGLDGTLSFVPAKLPFLRFGLTVPLRVYFRRDFEFSGSAGIGLSVAVEKLPAPKPSAAPKATP